jgi:hypothetical protein
MDQNSITKHIAATFEGVDIVRPEERGGPEIAWGDTFFIYDPHRDAEPKLQFPFATIITKDYGDFDCASNLNRPGVFCLNVGVSRETCRAIFGNRESGEESAYDFMALNTLMPHPMYAAQHWLRVLNPGDETFHRMIPFLGEAYEIAVKRYNRVRKVR